MVRTFVAGNGSLTFSHPSRWLSRRIFAYVYCHAYMIALDVFHVSLEGFGEAWHPSGSRSALAITSWFTPKTAVNGAVATLSEKTEKDRMNKWCAPLLAIDTSCSPPLPAAALCSLTLYFLQPRFACQRGWWLRSSHQNWQLSWICSCLPFFPEEERKKSLASAAAVTASILLFPFGRWWRRLSLLYSDRVIEWRRIGSSRQRQWPRSQSIISRGFTFKVVASDLPPLKLTKPWWRRATLFWNWRALPMFWLSLMWSIAVKHLKKKNKEKKYDHDRRITLENCLFLLWIRMDREFNVTLLAASWPNLMATLNTQAQNLHEMDPERVGDRPLVQGKVPQVVTHTSSLDSLFLPQRSGTLIYTKNPYPLCPSKISIS